MTKPAPPDDDSEYLSRLADILWEDQDDQTTEEIKRELIAEGLDPASAISRVNAMVADFLDAHSLDWLQRAEQERKNAADMVLKLSFARVPRSEMLTFIKNQPQLAARRLTTNLDDMDEAELRSIYEDFKVAEALDREQS